MNKKISWRAEMVSYAHTRLGNTIGKARLRYILSLLDEIELKEVIKSADASEKRRAGTWAKGFFDAIKASGKQVDNPIRFEGRGV